jgi:hypothetical protein
VEEALAEAIHENRDTWALILCRHAAVLAHSMGDHDRHIHYEERALPFAKEYRFAAYNFAQLLLKHGQVDRAERYADEAYKLSLTGTTDADRDLVAAILKQWPNIAQKLELLLNRLNSTHPVRCGGPMLRGFSETAIAPTNEYAPLPDSPFVHEKNATTPPMLSCSQCASIPGRRLLRQ